MKLFFILAAVTLAQAAKLDRVYLPPNAQESAGSGSFLQSPAQSYNNVPSQNTNAYTGASTDLDAYSPNAYSGFDARPERAQAAFERNAAILRQDNSNDGETYAYAYETENGIYAEENGVATNGVQAQGGYSYTGDDGKVYTVRYTADENGFVPQGDHLPTPPPIPEEILKALEQNARDEAAGIYDDGSYSDGKYSPAGNNQQQYYNSNVQPIEYNDDAIVTNSAIINNGARLNDNTVANTYLPPFAQRNSNQRNGNVGNTAARNNGARLSGNSVDKTYLPPFSQANNNQRNVNYNDDSAVINSANSARLNGNSLEKNYLPPNTQANNNQRNVNYNGDSVVTDAAVINNGARFNDNSLEKTYLPPNTQANNNQRNGNYNGDSIVTNAAVINNAARFNGNSLEKTYLPPFGQRSNNYRRSNGAAPIISFAGTNGNTRLNGNSVDRTYIPPSVQRRSNQRNGSYNSRNGYRY